MLCEETSPTPDQARASAGRQVWRQVEVFGVVLLLIILVTACAQEDAARRAAVAGIGGTESAETPAGPAKVSSTPARRPAAAPAAGLRPTPPAPAPQSSPAPTRQPAPAPVPEPVERLSGRETFTDAALFPERQWAPVPALGHHPVDLPGASMSPAPATDDAAGNRTDTGLAAAETCRRTARSSRHTGPPLTSAAAGSRRATADPA